MRTCADPDRGCSDFNFAIPELPYISGRELSGNICRISDSSSRLKLGDRVRPRVLAEIQRPIPMIDHFTGDCNINRLS